MLYLSPRRPRLCSIVLPSRSLFPGMTLTIGTPTPTPLTMRMSPTTKCLHRHPATSIGMCLAATLSAMHPCPKAGGGGEIMGLARNWTAWAKQSAPRAVVDALSHLSHPQPAAHEAADGEPGSFAARLFPAGRFALHWLFGICGIGPPILRHSGMGWDAQMATLACALGHKTVVLAASSNDNGLLHQEFVDFDVPEPFGWPAIPDQGAAAGTNDMQRCLQPFRWALLDRAAGRRAEARRHEQFRHRERVQS